MGKSATIRMIGTFLMLSALLLPVAPASAQGSGVQGPPPGQPGSGVVGQPGPLGGPPVGARSVGGGVVPPGAATLPVSSEPADCTTSADLTARYFISIQSTAGVDILNAVGRLVTPGGVVLGTTLPARVITFNNGDFESQAQDGSPGGGCVPAVNDGHANDIGTPFIDTFPANLWTVVITAPGFVPRTFVLPADDVFGAPGCSIGAGGQGRDGCLISMGTVQLQPLAAPAGRGVVAGSVFQVNGQPLDGATVVLTDASGNVHTRISGTTCDGAAIGQPGVPSDDTGFFCFADSTPETYTGVPGTFQNDGLGLPVGPASVVVVNNTVANCAAGSVPPGTACGFLPAFVQVNVVAAAVTGQDITFQNKFSPAPPAPAGAGAFGYVMNGQGQGVGGITITAGAVSTTSLVQTGLWTLAGLPTNVPVIFTISGPGIHVTNVRPSLSITRTTGGAGTWIDPSWIIVSQGPFQPDITIPVTGSAIIRGQALACQDPLGAVPGTAFPPTGVVPDPTNAFGAASCVPLTGEGAFALLWRDVTRSWAGATVFSGARNSTAGVVDFGTGGPNNAWPAVVPNNNLAVQPFADSPAVIAASPIDAGGNYCFGAAGVPFGQTPATPPLCVGQPPLLADTYFVTIVDDRPNNTCTPGFQPSPGGIGPAPCGHMMQTSQPVVALQDRVATVNFALQPRFSPGAIAADPGGQVVPGGFGGISGVFGFLRNASVPGGRPIQGVTVYAVPMDPTTAGVVRNGLQPGASTGAANNAARALVGFSASVNISGPGVLAGGILSSTPPLGAPVLTGPPYPGSDSWGLYRILGMVPGQSYAVIVEPPQGYNDCAPTNFNVGAPVLGFPGALKPTNINRCVVFVDAPAAGLWAAGADFAFSAQSLEPVEPGDIDRNLENILPLVANGAPTAALGGWELQTEEIHVTNSGPLRTVAELRFYASDGLGGAGVLAGTQTADLVPGGGRVFRAPEMPGGFLGWAGIWSFDADGPAGIYGASGLVAVRKLSARNAGGAYEYMGGTSREEIASPGQQMLAPLVYRKYGGTSNKWSSLIVITNVGESMPVTLNFTSNDRNRGDARRCARGCMITRYANRGGLLTLNLSDDADPDVNLLAEGTLSLTVTAGSGPLQPTGVGGGLPGWVRTSYPNGVVVNTIHVTTEGKMMMNGRAQQWLGPSSGTGAPDSENQGQLYAPLLFKNYNGWSSGIVLSAGQTSGGAAAMATTSFYDEGGTFIGSLNLRLSGSEEYIYLPEIEFLPDKYRGTVVVNFSGNSDSPGLYPGRSLRGFVAHVNYERNHAMSYDAIGMSAVVNRQEALGELPCISVGFVTCGWAADVWKTGTVSREDTQVGTQTGIRLFNPDPLHTGVPATTIVNYIDDTGVIWSEGTNVFSILPYHVHTVFPLYDARLPEIFRGSIRIASAGNYVVGIAQTVDYATMGTDASGAYNIQYHSGHSR